MQRKSEPYMVLEVILLQNHLKDFAKILQKFRSFVPGKTDLFSKSRNSGRKPCYQKRSKRFEPDLIIDHHESNANSDKQQTSSQQEASLRFTDPRYSLLKHFVNLSFAYCITNSS